MLNITCFFFFWSLTGFPQVFNWPGVACSPLWKNAVRPGSASSLIHWCLSGTVLSFFLIIMWASQYFVWMFSFLFQSLLFRIGKYECRLWASRWRNSEELRENIRWVLFEVYCYPDLVFGKSVHDKYNQRVAQRKRKGSIFFCGFQDLPLH